MKNILFGVIGIFISTVCMASENELTDRQRNAVNEAKNNKCSISKDEEIICANIMCDVGLLLGEYPKRCFDYKAKLLLLRAKLLPWQKLPKCFKRDENCNKTGRAGKDQMDTSYCMENTKTKNDTELCLGAMKQTDAGYCSDLGSEVERRACEEIKLTGNLTEEYCTNLAIEKADIRSQTTWNGGMTITGTLEWRNLEPGKQALYNQVFNDCMSLSAK